MELSSESEFHLLGQSVPVKRCQGISSPPEYARFGRVRIGGARGESKNRPRETPWCRNSRGNSCQVVSGALNNWVLFAVRQRQESDGRIVGVRCKGGPINDSVPGIPSAARAGAIEKHLDTTINSRRSLFQAAASAR